MAINELHYLGECIKRRCFPQEKKDVGSSVRYKTRYQFNSEMQNVQVFVQHVSWLAHC